MMQTGFAVIESSVVSRRHQANIMMKNVYDLCISAIVWWLWGYGIAFGTSDSNGLIGTDSFAVDIVPDTMNFFFQMAFASTTATIDSGAIAERMRFVP